MSKGNIDSCLKLSGLGLEKNWLSFESLAVDFSEDGGRCDCSR